MQAHIKIVQHPNVHRRAYHVTSELLSGEIRYGFGQDSYYGGAEKKISDEIKKLVDTLKMIPGIIGGTVKNYEIGIAISEAFEWEDIGPLVLGEIVNATFPEVLGGSILISNQLVSTYYVDRVDPGDDGMRYRYFQTMKREVVSVDFKGGRPILDVESFFDLKEAQKKNKENEV